MPSAGGTHHNTSNKSAKRSREDDERTKHSSGGRSRSSRPDTKDDSPSSKHSRINDRRAASARDITPTVDIVGEIIGHSSTGRSRTPDDPRKQSDSPFATPANKKRRGDEAAENEYVFYSDCCLCLVLLTWFEFRECFRSEKYLSEI